MSTFVAVHRDRGHGATGSVPVVLCTQDYAHDGFRHVIAGLQGAVSEKLDARRIVNFTELEVGKISYRSIRRLNLSANLDMSNQI